MPAFYYTVSQRPKLEKGKWKVLLMPALCGGRNVFLLLYSVMVDDDLYTCVIILCNDDDNGCICVLVHLIIVNDPVFTVLEYQIQSIRRVSEYQTTWIYPDSEDYQYDDDDCCSCVIDLSSPPRSG